MMTLWLTLLLLAQGESTAEIQATAQRYYQAAERDPSEPNLLQLVNHLIRYNGADQALKLLTWADGKHPRSAPLRVSRAAAYYALSRYDEAAAVICVAVDLDPADLRTLPFLADFRDISPLHAGAIHTRLAGYAKRFPRNAFAHFHYAMTSPADRREAGLREARRLDPSLPGPARELGILLDQQGRPQLAEPFLLEALRLEPKSVSTHYRLAQLYSRSGRAALAQRHFDEVKRLKQAPGDKIVP